MKILCIYLIPLFAVFTTLLSCFLLVRVAIASPRWRQAFFDACSDFVAESFPLQVLAERHFDQADLSRLLEERYERFMEALKQRIPMADMIMKGSIASGLKEQVQTEIAELLPELKQRMLERLMTRDEVKEWISSYLQQRGASQLDSFLKKLKRQFLWQIIFSLAAISFSFGLIQLLVFLYIS